MPASTQTIAALSAAAIALSGGGAAIAAAGSHQAPTGARLITNERTPARDPHWIVTSGSLFDRAGVWWTGAPDGIDPNATSSNGTGSDIFRVVSRSRAFADVKVSGTFTINRYASTARTPAVAWDGLHLFLRYQDQYGLYYASVARRDGAVVLKKKCAGGPSNGGTYYTLRQGRVAAPVGQPFTASAGVTTNPGGSVTVWLERGGTRLEAVDSGVGCAPITKPGGVGVRGDNVDAEVGRFVTTPMRCRL